MINKNIVAGKTIVQVRHLGRSAWGGFHRDMKLCKVKEWKQPEEVEAESSGKIQETGRQR